LAESFGHDVRIISPKKVKAFLTGHKNDANDALAIANAATQIGLKYSKPKNEEQQTLQSLDEASRAFLSINITSLGNHIRAMLYELMISKISKNLSVIRPDRKFFKQDRRNKTNKYPMNYNCMCLPLNLMTLL
jgi:transposase